MAREKKHPEFEKEQSKLKDIWQDCKSSMLTLCNKKKKKFNEKEEAKKKERMVTAEFLHLIKK